VSDLVELLVMSKTSNIIKMIDASPEMGKERIKHLSHDDIRNAGLSPYKEYAQKWCDCYLILRVARRLGYRALFGSNTIHLHRT
jgi:hypothetical protein